MAAGRLRLRHSRTKRIQCWRSSEDADGWHLALLCCYLGSSQFGGKVTKGSRGSSFTTFSSWDLEIYCILLLETTGKAFPVLKGKYSLCCWWATPISSCSTITLDSNTAVHLPLETKSLSPQNMICGLTTLRRTEHRKALVDHGARSGDPNNLQTWWGWLNQGRGIKAAGNEFKICIPSSAAGSIPMTLKTEEEE